MEFRILGQFTVLDEGRELPLGGARQRSVLAILLLHANEPVPATMLVDELWGARPPPTANKTVQVYVSRFRKALGEEAIETRPTGYLLRLEASALDSLRFEALLEQGGRLLAEGVPEKAGAVLREGLALWRGPALADFRNEQFARNEIGRLEELRLVALEQRLGADLALGRGSEVVGELEALVRDNPFRESLCGLLILALYRAGRQADALAVYRNAREALVDGLGLDPSRPLQLLERAILLQDPSLDLAVAADPLAPAPDDRESSGRPLADGFSVGTRKIVTILASSVVDHTDLGERLDPESLRLLMSRHFELSTEVVERHGGTVEPFAGDGVIAVFGVPAVHEDDALRAVRAAIEIRNALPELHMQARIGVNSGEVLVTGGPVDGHGLIAGDSVVVAKRFAAAAAACEVLIGEPTLALLGGAGDVEPLEPLGLTGRPEPVPAYRVVRVRQAPERPTGMEFVGRERELSVIREAWERARDERRCELVTLVGEAGVGKSRLAAEAEPMSEAQVVRGRCLSYGQGITYAPVTEVLKQLDVLPSDEAAAAAIRSLLRETETLSSAEEIAWAFRKTLEQAAAERPLIVVFDDLHWAEETFLDLVEHVALLSLGAPILLLCTARMELLDRRASWPVTVRLEPLSDEDVEQLIPKRIAGGLRDEIVRAAGGNPLFVREMLAVAGDTEGEIVVPPTLQALLAARLDQLTIGERIVIERAAVDGEVFRLGSVLALVPDHIQVMPHLVSLVRKRLIRPYRAEHTDEDTFCFRHLLIRDAAYAAMAKKTRADLHERHAAWLEANGTDLAELDELIGYHLERSYLYRTELGMTDDRLLAAAARRRLTAAGHRALLRLDYRAAVNLLERALELEPTAAVDLAVETDLVGALYNVGEGREALRRVGLLAERAAAAGDRVGELRAGIEKGMLRRLFEPEGATADLATLVEQALPVFEAARDDVALYTAYVALGEVMHDEARYDAQLQALDQAVAHAQRAGVPHELKELHAVARWLGTTPVSDLLAWLAEQKAGGVPTLREFRAVALAMLGRFDEARALAIAARVALTDRGGGIPLAFANAHLFSAVELLAGDPPAAVGFGAEGCRLFEATGEKGYLSTAAGFLAQALYANGQLDDALEWAEQAEELGAQSDKLTQMLSRQAKAKVLARRGEQAEAIRLAHEAVTLGAATDYLNGRADAFVDLADVLQLCGRPQDARPVLEQAWSFYDRKGNVVMADRVRARLVESPS